ncbi:MAG: cation diffusion facilitator family transporter [Gemmatimonadales bacterium]
MTVPRAALARRGKRLAWLTIGWNSLEAVIALVAGAIAGSVALTGFGVDSLIELTAGGAAMWRLHQDAEPAARERAERLTRRVVGVAFLGLALYVAWEAIDTLRTRHVPDVSVTGMVLAALSLLVMPILARAKRGVATGLSSRALASEAMQTDVCAWLSAILLGGLLLRATLGWWWADPVAALAMVPLLVREGVEGVRGRETCGCEDACEIEATHLD